MSDTNIANEAARTRKVLAKNVQQTFNSQVTGSFGLTANKALGQFAVVCVIGPVGSNQYTICRPIGLTDLSQDDWIMIPTDQVTATLARAEDPRKQEVEKARASERSRALVRNNLLVQKGISGKDVFYYPLDSETPRNDHLNQARVKMKLALSPYKTELHELKKLKGKEARAAGPRKQELNSEIQRNSNLLDYLPEAIQVQELKIRMVLKSPEFEAKIIELHPFKHRTLVGPFGDQPQVPIRGAKGFPLIDVVGAINKMMTCCPDLTEVMADMPSAQSGPPPPDPQAGRGRKGMIQGLKDSVALPGRRSKSAGPARKKG